MLIGAPIARLATRHDDRQPEPGGVVDRLGHEQQALARGRRVGARAGRPTRRSHTDIAANSDSTLMNSHGASSPGLHQLATAPSTMWVCGEIG